MPRQRKCRDLFTALMRHCVGTDAAPTAIFKSVLAAIFKLLAAIFQALQWLEVYTVALCPPRSGNAGAARYFLGPYFAVRARFFFRAESLPSSCAGSAFAASLRTRFESSMAGVRLPAEAGRSREGRMRPASGLSEAVAADAGGDLARWTRAG